MSESSNEFETPSWFDPWDFYRDMELCAVDGPGELEQKNAELWAKLTNGQMDSGAASPERNSNATHK